MHYAGVKRRKLANGKVNIVGASGVVTGIHLGFFRYVSNLGKPHVLRVNGLTADDYFGVIRDSARGADDSSS